MPATLQAELKKRRPFEAPEEEAYLNMVRSAGVLSIGFERLFRERGLSEATYNVLRILRGHAVGAGRRGAKASGGATDGVASGGVPCSQIGDEMVVPAPDITRLVDRLVESGLVERARTAEDRRVVLVRITRAGLKVLRELDRPVVDLHRAQIGHMTRAELTELNRLLCKARSAPTERS